MTIEELRKQSLHLLPKEEALAIIMAVRASRMTPKTKQKVSQPKERTTKKETEVNMSALLGSLDTNAASLMLAKLLERRKKGNETG